MEIKAKLNHLRMSPRKVRLVANLVKGMDLERAVVELRHRTRRAAVPILKLLQSAAANAKHDFQVNGGELYVKKLIVGEGPVLKRYRARAFGRAAPIRKRTSHVWLVLETKEGIRTKQMKKQKKEGPVVRDLTTEDRRIESEAQQEKHSSQVERASRIRTPEFVRRMFRRKVI